MKNVIIKVLKNSIGEELNIEVGDELVSVNKSQVKDYIDYKYQISDEFVILEIKKQNKEIWELEIEKDYDEDIGIQFENPLMDRIKVCSNKCIFCFIDQMPSGLRKSLYLKDDDTRLSFLYGNFITLTNLKQDEWDRIIKYRISPIKVSVHTTNKELRHHMMGTSNNIDIMPLLEKLIKAKITVDCQIVLLRDVNDKEELDKTIKDLASLYDGIRSLAVVPVGLTKHRDKLIELKPYDEESSTKVVNQITKLQAEFLKKLNTRFVFIADEFYIQSKKDFPSYESYESFEQLENGIGMCRLFKEEVIKSLKNLNDFELLKDEITLVTGYAAYDLLSDLSKLIMEKINIKINVVKITNNFFGEMITVSGLVTGKDIVSQLQEQGYKNIVIPRNMINDNGLLIDDMTIDDLKNELKTDVTVCETDGEELINLIIKKRRKDAKSNSNNSRKTKRR